MNTLRRIFESLTKNDCKNWLDREYEFILLFCNPIDRKMPWNEKVWNTITLIVDSLLMQSPEYKNTGLRVLKLEKQDNSEYYKEIKQGKLSWDKNFHSKWTVKVDEENIYFNNLELWTPRWTICEKISSPPDIFMHINNEIPLNNSNIKQFDALVVLAIATDLKINSQDQILKLSQILGSRKTVSHIRKWSRGKKDKDKNWIFSNWIQDTFSNGIYKGKSLHTFDFDELVFQTPYWNVLYESERDKKR